MRDGGDAPGGNAGLGEQRLDAVLHGVCRIFRCGEHFADEERAAGLVHDDQVGEGAADVDPESRWHGRSVADDSRATAQRAGIVPSRGTPDAAQLFR